MIEHRGVRPGVLSLFSGAGGMDKRFADAGFEIVWANDFSEDAVDTYRPNLGDPGRLAGTEEDVRVRRQIR